MGILDALLGRTKPVQANLDHLFGLASAGITLEASESLVSTGQGGVCFKPSVGASFAETEQQLNDMLLTDSPAGGQVSAKLSEKEDAYGYRWVVVGASEFDTLVTQVHFVNSTLQDNGYGPTLLCSVFGFAPKPAGSAPVGHASVYLVYLYKRGAFYPFVPTGAQKRDNEMELRLKNELASDLTIEPELDRWFPLWDLPVL